MNKIFIAFALLTSNATARADYYVSILGANKWSRIDSHSFIVYRGSKAICLVRTCAYIYPSSSIRFLDDTISNFDKMIVDNEVEDIREVKRL